MNYEVRQITILLSKVSRYLIAMKRGLMKPSWEQDEGKKGDEIGVFYDIWSTDANAPVTKRPMSHIAAPKVKWPGHAQSYRPPPEYLLSEEEVSNVEKACPCMIYHVACRDGELLTYLLAVMKIDKWIV